MWLQRYILRTLMHRNISDCPYLEKQRQSETFVHSLIELYNVDL